MGQRTGAVSPSGNHQKEWVKKVSDFTAPCNTRPSSSSITEGHTPTWSFVPRITSSASESGVPRFQRFTTNG